MGSFLTKLKAFFNQPLFTPRRTKPQPARVPLTPPPMPQSPKPLELTQTLPTPQAQAATATIEASTTTLPVEAPLAAQLTLAPTTDHLPVIRTELNFEQFPIFTVSTFRGKSRELVRRDQARDGGTFERRITIGKTDEGVEVGVLKTFDAKVFYILQDFWNEKGRPQGEPVVVSLYELAHRLHSNTSGSAYQQIKRALHHLREIPITWKAAYYAKNKDDFEELISVQNILTSLNLKARKKGEKVRAAITYELDDHIQQNLIAHHSHPLLIDTVLSFKSEYAQLLYPYIDRQLAHKSSFEHTLTRLWADVLALPSGYIRKPSDRKSQLTPAFRELTGKPLSTGVLTAIAVEKTADGTDYKAIFTKAARHGALAAKPRKPRQLHLKATTNRPKPPPAGIQPLNQPAEIDYLTHELTTQLDDAKSERFYRKVATYCRPDLIFQLLSQVKHDYAPTDITKSKGAIFTDLLKHRAPHLFKKQEPPAPSSAGSSSQKTDSP